MYNSEVRQEFTPLQVGVKKVSALEVQLCKWRDSLKLDHNAGLQYRSDQIVVVILYYWKYPEYVIINAKIILINRLTF